MYGRGAESLNTARDHTRAIRGKAFPYLLRCEERRGQRLRLSFCRESIIALASPLDKAPLSVNETGGEHAPHHAGALLGFGDACE